MAVTLDTLEGTPQELEARRDAVRRLAYFKWLEHGRRESSDLDFWIMAEREWIERYYVPHRIYETSRAVADG